jgi:hypothetical protein
MRRPALAALASIASPKSYTTLVDAATGISHPASLSPDYELLDFGTANIYLNRLAQPRAFGVGAVRVVPGRDDALDMLRSANFDPTREAVVEADEWARAGGRLPESATSGQPRSAGAASIREYRPERVVVEADLTAPGLLVLADAQYPGWRAVVDGQERPIVHANWLFRGVQLEPGAHRVEFIFAPASLRAGAWISGLALLAVIGAAVLPLARRRRLAG